MAKVQNWKKIPKDVQKRILKYVRTAKWVFAKSMPQWPHTYTLGKWNMKEFDFLMDCIQYYGFEDEWSAKRGTEKYLKLGKFKYWGFDLPQPLINKAVAIPNEEVRRKGRLYMKKHGLVFGPFGRAIRKSKAKTKKRK